MNPAKPSDPSSTRSDVTVEQQPPEWLWWGEVDGKDIVTFGRWPKRGARWRYKLAEIQPIEHDRAARKICAHRFWYKSSDGHTCQNCGATRLHENAAWLNAVDEVVKILAIYSHDGMLQSLESRQAFRTAARALLDQFEIRRK